MNSLPTLWIPGHSRIPGEETIIKLTRSRLTSEFIGLEPVKSQLTLASDQGLVKVYVE